MLDPSSEKFQSFGSQGRCWQAAAPVPEIKGGLKMFFNGKRKLKTENDNDLAAPSDRCLGMVSDAKGNYSRNSGGPTKSHRSTTEKPARQIRDRTATAARQNREISAKNN